MEIKTIRWQLDHAVKFDEEVNAALAEGWHLTRREVLMPPTEDKHIMLYAELVKLDPPPKPMNWQEAVETLRDTCEAAKECGPGCPMHAWCSKDLPEPAKSPLDWSLPDD